MMQNSLRAFYKASQNLLAFYFIYGPNLGQIFLEYKRNINILQIMKI